MWAADSYLSRFAALHPKRIDLSLGRMEHLLERLGHPERHLPPVIHVAGTNGKGSTVAFLRAMLEASGARVHAYTSPHLVRFHERIRIGRPGGGRLIEEAQLVEAFEAALGANGEAPITQFEITTAAALWLFAREPADFTLLEVGLGGRLDATNVVPRPLATVITPIGIDHREFLGDTIEAIAAEKAGILKRGVPAVLAEQAPEARAVCEAAAERLGLRPRIGGQDFRAHEERGRLIYEDEDALLDLPLPRLAGRHQLANAATAIATLRAVAPERASQAALAQGLGSVVWPARLQRLTGTLASLLPPGSELWLDGGHNAHGAQALAEAIGELEAKSPRPFVLLAGILARKDAREILRPFRGLAGETYGLRFSAEAIHPPEALAAIARELGMRAASAGDTIETLRFLAGRNWPAPPRILILGSLFLSGEVLKADGYTPA